MKVLAVKKTSKHKQYDISTGTENFYAKVGEKWALIHNSPAVFAGTDPRDGKFFVAKKGIFNKNPKVYKTDADVDADTSGDLAKKLKLSLKHFANLGIKGVIQGDLLFTKSDLKSQKIAGLDYLTFHPNTIVYAVQKDSKDAEEIKRAEIGVVWHTTYTGDDFESMKANYGVNVQALKKTSKVWQQDAMLRDLSNVATMSSKETDRVNAHLSRAGKLFNEISGSTLRELEQNQDLAQLIEQFNNTFVRSNTVISDTEQHVRNLINWIENKYQKEIDKRKSERGKQTQRDKLSKILKFFSRRIKEVLKKCLIYKRQLFLRNLYL